MKCLYVFILALFFQHQIQACSAFYATDGTNIFGAKNADWKISASQLHFVPPVNNNFGYLNFNIEGYINPNTFGECGCINDQGLFYEWEAYMYPQDFSYYVPGTSYYDGNVMILI